MKNKVSRGDVFKLFSLFYHRSKIQRYSIKEDDIKLREAAYPHICEALTLNIWHFFLDKFHFLIIVQMNFRSLNKSANCLNRMYN